MGSVDNFNEVLAKVLGLEASQSKNPALRLVEEVFFGRHYHQQTEIQKRAIDPIFSGRSALILSATASGKTEAAVVPVIAQIISAKRDTIALYLAPTKALINDLVRRLSPHLEHLMVPFSMRHGDRKTSTKIFNVLFTTPESLDVLLCRDEAFLDKIRFVIVDEVHQVFNSARGVQITILLERLKKKSRKPLQRVALSATVARPGKVAEWLRGTDSSIELFAAQERRSISPKVFLVRGNRDVAEIVRSSSFKKILVFANTRRRCEKAFLNLKDCEPYKVYIHYSSLEKEDREFVESGFKTSEFAICVATSTLEMGVDIGSVELVVFAEPPESVDSFLQRSGRGGRRSESTSLFLLSDSLKQILQYMGLVSLAGQNKLEDNRQGKFYSAVAQQVLSYIAGKHNHRLIEEEVFQICECIDWLSNSDILAILENLVEKGYLVYDRKWKSYQMDTNLAIKYHRGMIHSNIVIGDPGIEVFIDKRKLGDIPLPHSVQLGSVFLFAGKFWKVVRIRDHRLFVTPTKSVPDPVLPRWGGSGLPVSSVLSEEMKRIFLTDLDLVGKIAGSEAKRRLSAISNGFRRKVPHDCIIQEERNKRFIYYTFGGTSLNLFLKIVLSTMQPHEGLRIASDDLALISNYRLDFSLIPVQPYLIHKIIKKNWRVLRPLVSLSESFSILPTFLQQEEILSQVVDDEILARIVDFPKRQVVSAKLGLVAI